MPRLIFRICFLKPWSTFVREHKPIFSVYLIFDMASNLSRGWRELFYHLPLIIKIKTEALMLSIFSSAVFVQPISVIRNLFLSQFCWERVSSTIQSELFSVNGNILTTLSMLINTYRDTFSVKRFC